MLNVLKVSVIPLSFCSEDRSTDLLVLLCSKTKCVRSDAKNILQAVLALHLGKENTVALIGIYWCLSETLLAFYSQ